MVRDVRILLSGPVLLLLFCSLRSWGEPGHDNKDSLKLKESNHSYPVVEFEMAPKQHEKIKTTKGQKLILENTVLKFNGDTLGLRDAHLHGQTTLYFERKSYSVDASEKIKLCEECEGLGAFYLVSLTMDKNYFHNRLCFDLLRVLNLFHLQYTFSEVKINGQSQGIYLLLQRPQDWSLKEIKSPFIVRRGGDRLIERERFQKEMDKESKKKYHQQFISIYKLIEQHSGQDLYGKLNEVLHLEDYMRWMAFNFIVKNGDYADELFFYVDPETNRFRILPWDYDDVFKPQPHEGFAVRNTRMDPSSLIFSSEDKLDLKIANDPYLYAEYLKCLTAVMEELSDPRIEDVLNGIYHDLSPLYASKDILDAVSKDGYNTSPAILKKELEGIDSYFETVRFTLFSKKKPK
jgi:spore coat protein H